MKEFFLKLKCKYRGIVHILTYKEFIVLSIVNGVDDNYTIECTFKMPASDVVEAIDGVRPFFKECEHLDETLHMAKRILLEAGAPNEIN